MSGQRKTAQIVEVAACSSDAAVDFAALYRQNYPRLTTIAAGILGKREGAEDIVQQAACIALEKRAEEVPVTQSAGWLAGVVRNCALNHRKKTRRRKTYAADPLGFSQIAVDATSAADLLPVQPETGKLSPDQQSFDDEVLRALQNLSPDARCCVLLRTVLQLNYTEISELMEMPEGTAMSHVHRSKQMLRKQLVDYANAKDTRTTRPK